MLTYFLEEKFIGKFLNQFHFFIKFIHTFKVIIRRTFKLEEIPFRVTYVSNIVRLTQHVLSLSSLGAGAVKRVRSWSAWLAWLARLTGRSIRPRLTHLSLVAWLPRATVVAGRSLLRRHTTRSRGALRTGTTRCTLTSTCARLPELAGIAVLARWAGISRLSGETWVAGKAGLARVARTAQRSHGSWLTGTARWTRLS